MKKKIMSLLLVLTFLFGSMPVLPAAYAATGDIEISFQLDEEGYIMVESKDLSPEHRWYLMLSDSELGGAQREIGLHRNNEWFEDNAYWFEKDNKDFFEDLGYADYQQMYNYLADKDFKFYRGFTSAYILGEQIDRSFNTNINYGNVNVKELFLDALYISMLKKVDIQKGSAYIEAVMPYLELKHSPTNMLMKIAEKVIPEYVIDNNISSLLQGIKIEAERYVEEEVIDYNKDETYADFKELIRNDADVVDYTNFEKVSTVVLALSSEILSSSPVHKKVKSALEYPLISFPSKEEVLAKYLASYETYLRVNASRSETEINKRLIYLQSIWAGRGSLYSNAFGIERGLLYEEYRDLLSKQLYRFSDSDPVKFDPNMSALARIELNSLRDEFSELYSDLDMSEIQDTEKLRNITVALRLRYAYYAMQADPSEYIDSSNELVTISRTDDGTPFGRSVKYIEMPNRNISQATYYTDFLNVVNEIPYIRKQIESSDLPVSLLTGMRATTGGVVELAKQLRQLKAAVSFLESLPIDTTEVVDMWYEEFELSQEFEGRSSISMEELYALLMSLELSEEFLEKPIDIDETRPLSRFIDIKSSKLNTYLEMGIAQSALYIPLQSNINEIQSFAQITSENFFSEFYSRWGSYRKAVYIDTSVNAATNTFNTGKVGNMRVATLADLSYAAKEIVLYTGTEYYNMHKILDARTQIENKYSEVKSKIDGTVETVDSVTTIVQGIGTMRSNDEKWATRIGAAIEVVGVSTDLLMEKVVGPKVEEIIDEITPYLEAVKDFLFKSEKDSQFFTTEEIAEVLDSTSYNVAIAHAVQSASVRDKGAFMYVESVKDTPIFVSSNDLWKTRNSANAGYNAYYNYVLLSNIDNNSKIDYKSALDFNSPLYVDIFGNIITESGYVVIPAAANATLQSKYSPYTNAFLSSYGENVKVSTSIEFFGRELREVMEKDDTEDYFVIRNLTEGGVIKLADISTASDEVLKRFYSIARANLASGGFNNQHYFSNVVVEVLRGAPLRYIDREKEGINPPISSTKSGVAQAVKLEKLQDALDTKSQNNIVAIPNLTFASGVEVVILFVYKITMLVVILLVLAQIFVMGMTGKISLTSIWKVLVTIIVTFVLVYTLPVVNETTYYQLNKQLLQDDALLISMLNLEKRESGVEVGMLELREPKEDTVLYLKMEDLNIPWYDLFFDVIYTPISKGMTEIYKEYYSSSSTSAIVDEFEVRGDAVYVDVQEMFDSSTVVFRPDFKMIYQYINRKIPASFYSPYYVILDSLLAEINEYNSTNNSYSYTTSLYRGGKIVSVGLIKDYLTSEYFLSKEGEDYMYLRQIYNLYLEFDYTSPFTEEQLENMRTSAWYNDNLSPEQIGDRIKLLNEEARKFVTKNELLIGRISDETFMKMMAMHLSIKHNQIFNAPSADSIEIYNISPEDIIRISMVDTTSAMKGSPYSYPRFVFENAGEVGVILAAVLEMVLFVVGWIKPAVTLALFVLFYFSIFIQRMILRKEGANVKNYLLLVGLIVGINISYSILIKASTLLPATGLPPAVCLIGLIVLHSFYAVMFVTVVTKAIVNWRDLGYEVFVTDAKSIKEKLSPGYIRSRINEREDVPTNEGWEEYTMLKENDKQKVYQIIREDEV